MATASPEQSQTVESFFKTLNSYHTLLTTYSNSYKTLMSHFTHLENSLEFKSQTLDSQLQKLNSNLNQTLDSIKTREDSLPEILSTLSDNVESRKTRAFLDATKPTPSESASLSEKLRWVCSRMEPELLVNFLLVKRGEASTLRLKMSEALSECVDAERFIIEAVRFFVDMKREKKAGMTDNRWACSMAVGSMFPPDNLKEGKVGMGGLSRVFAKKAVERAKTLLKEWKEVADEEAKEGSDNGCGMWHSEAAMFIEVVLGFGLKEMFDDEVYKKLIFCFCGRRVMAKLAVPIFGDRIADFIEELVKDGKEVEAIYFAFESNLTDKFKPESLLKTAIRKSKKNGTEILEKGHNSSSATDEPNSMEMITIKAIIKCVEDLNIEQFPLGSLRKKLSLLEKAKADKKGTVVRYSKRTGGGRPSLPPSTRPAKFQKRSMVRRDHGSSSRPSPYSGRSVYQSLPTYNTGHAPSTYQAPSY